MNWLGQKPDSQTTQPTQSTQPAQPPKSTAPSTPPPAPTPATREVERPVAAASRGASIGKSIHVKGELTGSEDLAIEGTVEGKISLSGCRVSIGPSGQVRADITAKTVVVGGQVKGSIRAEERVEVAANGNLIGDVRAPRVVLADGAKFKGSIDMDPASAGSSASQSQAKASNGKSESSSSKPARDPMLTPDDSTLYVGATER
jgi:cytoskeletal protein CcmA (bactofilin family)